MRARANFQRRLGVLVLAARSGKRRAATSFVSKCWRSNSLAKEESREERQEQKALEPLWRAKGHGILLQAVWARTISRLTSARPR